MPLALRKRTRPIALGENTEIHARPRARRERESQASAEGETVTHDLQRRRSPKADRRIYAGPPLPLGEADPEVVRDETEMSVRESMPIVTEPDVDPVVEAVPVAPRARTRRRVVKDTRPDDTPAGVEVAPESVVEAVPVAPRARTRRRVVKDTPEVVEVAPESVVEAVPVAPRARTRRRVAKDTRPDDTPAVVEVAPEVVVVLEPAELAEEPVIDLVEPTLEAPPAQTSWDRPNSLWLDRVFNNGRHST